jgi:4-amino-4-deoxy-L-arabinose transferase-like glycosyltransferase
LTKALAIFAVVNLGLFAYGGVHLGGDTGLFLDGAQRLLEGRRLIQREPSYLGYLSVVAFSQGLGGGLVGVVLLQIAVATLGAGAVYRLGMELGGSRTAMVAAGLLTVDVDVNRWHTYVLADSLFISMFAVCAWAVYLAAHQRQGAVYFVALGLLLATGLIRPEGWFAFPAAGLYWVARGVKRRPARLMASAGVVAACVAASLVVAPRLSGNLRAVNPAGMLERGQTIWDYDGWRLAMPESAPDSSGRPPGPIQYALRHPIATGQLMLARIAVHLAHVRPFYSLAHNLAIVVWLLPIYALAAVAIRTSWTQPLTRWCAMAFASQAVVVAMTHADWDGRYLAHVMPIVYPFAAAGFWMLVRRRAAVARAA